MAKVAIVVYSDPKSGTEESLGRLLNALLLTYELKERQQEVSLVFQGTGVRWASEVVKPEHPAHALYNAVKDKVAGVCGGCADVFGATSELESAGVPLNYENQIPGTTGVLDLSRFIENGHQVVTF
ncbi:MAG TPA: hypothetical protein DEH78_07935 [Solibacterales bacterium]|nr:hypothetical protein [Bryobacterales bacterium]